MATLKFEIDTEDIFSGDPEDGYGKVSFEDLVRDAIKAKTKEQMIKSFAGEAFQKTSKNIALEITHQVTKKLYDLVNEDIVMQDRWGKPTFIGTVEDYIKQQIDNKLMRPVNSQGQTLSGCSLGSDNDTWIEYTIKKTIDSEMKSTLRKVEENVSTYCRTQVDKVLNDFKDNTLNKAIMDRLNAVGVGV